jgi:hypothetical protein
MSPRELDKYTMEEILVLNDIMSMRRDYKEAANGYDIMTKKRFNK